MEEWHSLMSIGGHYTQITRFGQKRKEKEREITDRYYTSNTYFQLADESAEFYKNPWQEIYELLKQELK